jgi:hypothetical protein
MENEVFRELLAYLQKNSTFSSNLKNDYKMKIGRANG